MRKRTLAPILVLALLCACNNIAPGNDPVVVDAQRIIPSAHDTINAFLKTEAENHVIIKAQAPQISNYANMVRRNAPHWFETAWSTLDTYRHNRSPQNKATLQTSLAVLGQVITQIQTYSA